MTKTILKFLCLIFLTIILSSCQLPWKLVDGEMVLKDTGGMIYGFVTQPGDASTIIYVAIYGVDDENVYLVNSETGYKTVVAPNPFRSDNTWGPTPCITHGKLWDPSNNMMEYNIEHAEWQKIDGIKEISECPTAVQNGEIVSIAVVYDMENAKWLAVYQDGWKLTSRLPDNIAYVIRFIVDENNSLWISDSNHQVYFSQDWKNWESAGAIGVGQFAASKVWNTKDNKKCVFEGIKTKTHYENLGVTQLQNYAGKVEGKAPFSCWDINPVDTGNGWLVQSGHQIWFEQDSHWVRLLSPSQIGSVDEFLYDESSNTIYMVTQKGLYKTMMAP